MSDAGRVIGDYGLNTPRLTRGLGFTIAGSLLVTVVAGILDEVTVMGGAFAVAVVTSTAGLVMVRSSRVHKIRERGRLVDRLALEGNERVLDLGSARGLLLLEVARRLDARGRAVGVDSWRGRRGREDESILLGNAAAEGVQRFDVVSADVLRLPFREGAFDAVVSGLALHHVAGFESRVHVVRELARALRVGGKVVLIDHHHTETYVDALRACNFVDVGRSRRLWRLLPPARYVAGTKAEKREREPVPLDEPVDDDAVMPSSLDEVAVQLELAAPIHVVPDEDYLFEPDDKRDVSSGADLHVPQGNGAGSGVTWPTRGIGARPNP